MKKKIFVALFIGSLMSSTQSMAMSRSNPPQDWPTWLQYKATSITESAITYVLGRFIGDWLYENLREEGREKAAARNLKKQFCSDELSMAKDWENSVKNVRQDIADLDEQCKAGDKESLELRERLKAQHRYLVRQAFKAREHAISLAQQRTIDAAPAA